MTNFSNQSLEKAVISTLVYFDIFNYPLTETEIKKWLYVRQENSHKNYTLYEIKNAFGNSRYLNDRINFAKGYYFLKGRDELVARRNKNHIVGIPRWKKLQKICRLLKVIPFVRMIAACNTMAINDIKPTSDIDVFIIVKSGRIWVTRFMITSIVSLIGQWRHKDSIANKICLSFYTTEDNLNFNNLAKQPYDIYLIYWIALVVPLLDRGTYQEFMRANQWIKQYLPNIYPYQAVEYEREVALGGPLDLIRSVFQKLLSGKFGDRLEQKVRKIQRKKMEKNYFSAAKKKDTDVIISDKMLKFHEVDKRNEFREKFEKRLREVL